MKRQGFTLVEGQNYASSHRQRWPDVMSESDNWGLIGDTRTDYYKYDEPGNRDDSVTADDEDGPVNSNTANFWKLITSAGAAPAMFVCPSTDHLIDDRVVDFDDVRDFRNEEHVSYSYQNALGSYTLTQTSVDQPSLMAVAADANPQRGDYYSESKVSDRARGSDGPTDAKLDQEPKFEPSDITDRWNEEGLSGSGITDAWMLNSPNHNFQGQNVLYLDGHVAWTLHPYCGIGFDNIWSKLPESGGTGGSSEPLNPSEWSDIEERDSDSYDGTSEVDVNEDSFLVP